ncbi:uncharacterized protein LOC121867987 [Homarus americanus]|uniref:uncharacterized protein LOC121867987 n=1 Tax=Homarus americanus TaxID=6706 RepID=UPI001C45742F|nr:uncharacterized protein LOC121867987 [Homarus americanus]
MSRRLLGTELNTIPSHDVTKAQPIIHCLLTDQSDKELAHVVSVSGCRWVVVLEEAVGVVEAAFNLLPSGTLKKMWVLGDLPGTPSLADLMRTDLTVTPIQEANFDLNRELQCCPSLPAPQGCLRASSSPTPTSSQLSSRESTYVR